MSLSLVHLSTAEWVWSSQNYKWWSETNNEDKKTMKEIMTKYVIRVKVKWRVFLSSCSKFLLLLRFLHWFPLFPTLLLLLAGMALVLSTWEQSHEPKDFGTPLRDSYCFWHKEPSSCPQHPSTSICFQTDWRDGESVWTHVKSHQQDKNIEFNSARVLWLHLMKSWAPDLADVDSYNQPAPSWNTRWLCQMCRHCGLSVFPFFGQLYFFHQLRKRDAFIPTNKEQLTLGHCLQSAAEPILVAQCSLLLSTDWRGPESFHCPSQCSVDRALGVWWTPVCSPSGCLVSCHSQGICSSSLLKLEPSPET